MTLQMPQQLSKNTPPPPLSARKEGLATQAAQLAWWLGWWLGWWSLLLFRIPIMVRPSDTLLSTVAHGQALRTMGGIRGTETISDLCLRGVLSPAGTTGPFVPPQHTSTENLHRRPGLPVRPLVLPQFPQVHLPAPHSPL